MTLRTLRILLIIDILSLVAVAAIHAGVFGGTFQRAAMYEAGVAVVLGIGLALTFAGPTLARWGAFVTQLLALFGVGTGIYMATRGMAPNTIGDYAYHAFAIVMLVAGLVGALRLTPREITDAARRTADSLGHGRP
jgi:hypothetical protein